VIAFLTLCYVGLLFLLVKLGVIRWTLGWKISPLLWMLVLLIVLFIPMQWGAPSGSVTLYQYTIEIIPNVSGQVIEVPVTALEPVARGDTLFVIDPVPFEANVRDLEARLLLANTRLRDSRALASRGAAAEARVDKTTADVDSLEAQLVRARFDLEQTTVRAPADGTVVALTLRPGQRVANIPLRSWMAFSIETQIPLVVIPQYLSRHVRQGQEVEVTLKSAPGRTLRATVSGMLPSNAQGQISPNGLLPRLDPNPPPEPFGVRLAFEPGQLEQLDAGPPGGSIGVAAIYTESSQATHLIRRVMIRMQAWLNYVLPF
jgi:multidrug resistance efflux pump